MRLLVLFIVCNLCSNCFSQPSNSFPKNTFILNGQVIGRDTGHIILSYQDSTNLWINDTNWLKDGKFFFKGFISQPTLAVLGDPKYVNGQEINSVSLFLEPKEMAVRFKEGDYENADLRGSNTQEEYKIYLKEKNEVQLKWKAITDEYERISIIDHSIETDSMEKERINKKLKQIRPKLAEKDQELENIKYSYIAKFPNSYISAYFLAFFQKRPTLKFQKATYEKFGDNVKNSRYGKYISAGIKRRLLVDMGAFAPDFSAYTFEGKLLKLSEMKGKYVLLDFWASWCIPCREGIPDLKKYYDLYHSKGFELIAISIDRRKSDWEKALLEEKMPYFYNVLVNDEISQGYENVFLPIPSQILINREGVIIWKLTADVEDEFISLKNILKENLAK